MPLKNSMSLKNRKKSMAGALKTKKPRKSDNVPATKKMVDETRAELKSDLTSLKLIMKAGFKRIDARFAKMDARFARIDARFARMEERFAKTEERFAKMEERFASIDERFARLEAKISSMEAMMHRMMVLVEEQNARNVFVLDGYASLDARLSKLEKKSADV